MQTEIIYKQESYNIIGVCMEVHKELGKGFSEIIYGDALEIEFKNAGINYHREVKYNITYKGNLLPHYYVADFIIDNKIVSDSIPIYNSLNFGFYPDTIITEITPELTGGFPRCNDTINYWLSINNEGTTVPSGIIHLQIDSAINYITADFPTDSIVGNNIYWSYDSLFFRSSKKINLQLVTMYLVPWIVMKAIIRSKLKIQFTLVSEQ